MPYHALLAQRKGGCHVMLIQQRVSLPFYCDEPPLGFLDSMASALMTMDKTIMRATCSKEYRLAQAAALSDAGTSTSISAENGRLSLTGIPALPPSTCHYCREDFEQSDERNSHVQERQPDTLLCNKEDCASNAQRFASAMNIFVTNAVSSVFMLVFIVVFCFPFALPVTVVYMNYTCVLLGGFTIISGVFYLLLKKDYVGPQVLQLEGGAPGIAAEGLRAKAPAK